MARRVLAQNGRRTGALSPHTSPSHWDTVCSRSEARQREIAILSKRTTQLRPFRLSKVLRWHASSNNHAYLLKDHPGERLWGREGEEAKVFARRPPLSVCPPIASQIGMPRSAACRARWSFQEFEVRSPSSLILCLTGSVA
jgi:hypothetical protein